MISRTHRLGALLIAASLAAWSHAVVFAMSPERSVSGDCIATVAGLRSPALDLLGQHFGADADVVPTLIDRAMLMPSGVLVSGAVHKDLLVGAAMIAIASPEPSVPPAMRDAMEKYAIMACTIRPMAEAAPTVAGVPDDLQDDAILFLVSTGMNASVRGIRRIRTVKSDSWIGVIVECEPGMVSVAPPRVWSMANFTAFLLSRAECLWMHGLTAKALSRAQAVSVLGKNSVTVVRAKILEARIRSSAGNTQAAGAMIKQIIDSFGYDTLLYVTEDEIVSMCQVLFTARQYSDAMDLASAGLALHPSSLQLEAMLEAILSSHSNKGVERP